jgi:hypothetical protein
MSSGLFIQQNLYLKGKDFHRLSQLETPFNKNFTFKVHDQIFKLTKEEAFLITPNLFLQIQNNKAFLEIPLPSNQLISSDELITAFTSLISLFSTSVKIEINNSNLKIYNYFADQLQNSFLQNLCRQVTVNKSQFFEFTSMMFSGASHKALSSLNDFSIYFGKHEFQCNKLFSSCLSNSIFQLVLVAPSLTECHFDEIKDQRILNSLFNILKGIPFEISNIPPDDLIQSFNLIGCSFEIDFRSFDDLISFVSSPSSHLQKELYDKSIELITSNFDQMTTKHIQQLSFQNIHSLMIHQSLKLQSETFLFNLFKEDERKLLLFQFVKFPYLDFSSLKSFFQNFDFNEINFELFNKFKELIFLDDNEIPKYRWNQVLTFIYLEDYDFIIKDLKRIFQNEQIDIKELIKKHSDLLNKISNLENDISNLLQANINISKKNSELETEISQLIIRNSDLTNKNQNYLKLLSFPYGNEITISDDEKVFLKKIEN